MNYTPNEWAALAALLIGLTIRLLKSDTKLPIDIPPRWRAPLALGLGLLAACLEQFATGAAWKQALADGLFAALAAIAGHNLLVDSIRGGRELPVPGMMKSDAKTPPPPPLGPSLFVLVLCAFCLNGCAKFWKVLDLAADKAACVVTNQHLPNDQILLRCAIEPGDFERYADLLSKSREASARAVALERAANENELAALKKKSSDRSDDACRDGGSP